MFNIWLEIHRAVSIFWAMQKWQIIGFGKNLLVDIIKAFLGTKRQIKLITA